MLLAGTAYALHALRGIVPVASLWPTHWPIAVQLLLVAGYGFYPAIGFMGLLFIVVWGVIAYLRAEVLRRQREGRLPSQQPPPE
mgnify:CR=1 FL=1